VIRVPPRLAALFIAGLYSGILVGLAIMLMVYLYGSEKRGLPRKERVGFKKLFLDFKNAILRLTLCNCGRRIYCGGDFSRLRKQPPSLLYYAVLLRFY